MISPDRFASKLRGWMNRRLPLMITCARMDALLVDYLDGTLTPRQRRRFELHTRLCADCSSFLQAYRATVALGKLAFNDPGDEFARRHRRNLLPAQQLDSPT